MNYWSSLSKRKSLLVFSLTIIVSLYWFAAQVTNVYQFPLLGVIYELVWVGMVLALFGLPVFSFILLVKNKFDLRSLYFYSFIISVASVIILITQFS